MRDGEGASSNGRLRAIDAVALGTAVGSLAGLSDGLAAVGSGFDGNRLGFVAYGWALSVCFVTTLASLHWAWCWLGRGLTRLHVALFVLWAGLPLVAFACWVPTSWIAQHWRTLSTTGRYLAATSYLVFGGLALGASFGVWAVSAAYRRAKLGNRLQRALLASSLLLAAVSYAADRWVLVGLYDDFHCGLTAAFLLSLAAVLLLVVRGNARVAQGWRTASWRSVSWLVPGVALLAVLALETWPPDVFGPSDSVLFQKLVAGARAKTDFDHDGASGLFGGTDCAGFDARLAPDRFDFPGNSKDEDCTGQDSEWPLPPAKTAYAIPAAKGFNVVLITVDALRADHLGAYGYARNTTPVLDALAARSVRFAKAIAPSSKTFGSLPALQSGLYPSNVPRSNAKSTKATRKELKGKLFGITSDAPMLSELFAAQGYQTATFLSPSALMLLGLGRGFAEAEATRQQVEQSITAFGKHTAPFFHWLHINAPHEPYEAHPEYPFGNSDVDRYDSEIAHDDARIGQLLKALEVQGLTDKTIVIVSADHGEEFRDHGGQFHTFRLYRELVHVPLIVFIPGVAPRVVNEPVETLGIAATLCELLDLAPSPAKCDRFDGRSLLGAMAGQADDWGAYSELVRKDGRPLLQSLYTSQWHIIRDYKKDRVELYDVVNDPNERKNVAKSNPELTRSLAEQLGRRPLVRAGEVFREYERTGDLSVVAAGLPALQNPTVLPHAFALLAREPARFRTAFSHLKDRPGLPRELRSRAAKYASTKEKKRPKG